MDSDNWMDILIVLPRAVGIIAVDIGMGGAENGLLSIDELAKCG